MKFNIRNAKITDAYKIRNILKKYGQEADIIIRPLNDIYENLRDFKVVEYKKKVIGIIALHIYWRDLAEIRSFVIEKKYRSNGLGKLLLNEAIKEAKKIGIRKIFALTKIPKFFIKNGFKKISRKKLPQKIWKDCLLCPKYPNYCDEQGVIKRI